MIDEKGIYCDMCGSDASGRISVDWGADEFYSVKTNQFCHTGCMLLYMIDIIKANSTDNKGGLGCPDSQL